MYIAGRKKYIVSGPYSTVLTMKCAGIVQLMCATILQTNVNICVNISNYKTHPIKVRADFNLDKIFTSFRIVFFAIQWKVPKSGIFIQISVMQPA